MKCPQKFRFQPMNDMNKPQDTKINTTPYFMKSIQYTINLKNKAFYDQQFKQHKT